VKKQGTITLLGKYIPIASMPTLSGGEKGMMLNAFLGRLPLNVRTQLMGWGRFGFTIDKRAL
jgi:hypothetical protein